eukprot:653082-Pyramimonas_sp.AAC.1
MVCPGSAHVPPPSWPGRPRAPIQGMGPARFGSARMLNGSSPLSHDRSRAILQAPSWRPSRA